jgi:hypothetical protein
VEQAYLTATEVSHFLEEGSFLKCMTESTLVAKTIRLVTNCEMFASVVNVRILKQCSVFLKELTNDNAYARDLLTAELDSHILEEKIAATADNIDFYWNLVEFHFNVVLAKEGNIGV